VNNPIQVGDSIAGKYRVERLLGRGSMGVVVAATDLGTQALRALKVMLPEAARNPRAAKCFISEAWTACSLQSEHVARVLDVGEHGELPFVVMEHLEGSDLGQVLELRKALPVREAALLAIQVCDALAEAHALGVVHRDIKPANLFLTRRKDGAPVLKVLDFGLAKVAASAFPPGQATPRSALVGSPSFMSPEQILGERELDGRSDLWAVGVLLYRMLTSQLPFRPPGRVGLAPLLVAIMERDPVPPSQLMPSVSPALDAVILRCLEKDRAARFASAADLAVALLPFAPEAARLVAGIGLSKAHGVADADEACCAVESSQGPISIAPPSCEPEAVLLPPSHRFGLRRPASIAPSSVGLASAGLASER
jgi:serine/threonine-protein kinase